MKKAIVYKKDRKIGTAQGEQTVAKKGDIERYFDSEKETPNGFLFSQGLVEIVDVEAMEDESDAIFVVEDEIPGKYTKSGEIDLALDEPPMKDDGQGGQVLDDTWARVDTVPEKRYVRTDVSKKLGREARGKVISDKVAKKKAAKQLLKDNKADLDTPSVAKLAPLVRALVELLED